MLTTGSQAIKENGVTHKVVWQLFSREFQNNILLNDIDGVPAHQWMTSLRETANYKNARFPDPIVPAIFSMLDRNGINSTLMAYHNDDSNLLTFDPDHAIIAFPLECIKQARKSMERTGDTYDDEQISYIELLLKRLGVDPAVMT